MVKGEQCKFKDLYVGDFYKFGVIEGIKLSDSTDLDLHMPLREPNCVMLHNLHYGVISQEADVVFIKSKKDFCGGK